MDVIDEHPYKFYTFSVDRAVMAPYMGLSVIQEWPYAPYHELSIALPYAARAYLFFMVMAVLTLLIYGTKVEMGQVALLGILFPLPFLILMSGYFPYPDLVSPANLATYMIGMTPVISIPPIAMAYFLLRKNMSCQPLYLVLLLMTLFMAGYIFISFLPDEQKRNSTETLIQSGMIAYVFLLTLYTRVRTNGGMTGKWFAGFRARFLSSKSRK